MREKVGNVGRLLAQETQRLSTNPSLALAEVIFRRLDSSDLPDYLVARRDELSIDVVNALQVFASAADQSGNIGLAAQIVEVNAEIARLLDVPRAQLELLYLAGDLYHQNGDRDRMLAAWQLGRAASEQLLDTLPEAAAQYVRISISLADAVQDDTQLTRRWLAEMRSVCDQHDITVGIIWSELLLAKVCVREGDSARARDYILSFKHHFDEAGPKIDPALNPPTGTQAALIAIDVASHHYYTLDDFETTARIARIAIALAPDAVAAYMLLGFSLGRLKKAEEAEAVWTQAVERAPQEASLHFNHAGARAGGGHLEKAIESLTQAVKLAPQNVRYRWELGRLQGTVGRHEDALATYRAVVDMCQIQSAGAEAAAESKATKQIDYERNLPLRDVADFAHIGIIESLLALGDTERGLAEADQLIRSGDAAARYGAFIAKADFYLERELNDEALAAVTGALAALPNSVDPLRTRIQLLRNAGRIAEAIEDLASLADRHRDPKAAAEHLSAILESEPDHPQALKWRGFAWFEESRPSKAVFDLRRAVTLLPNDYQVHLWLGLSLILFSPFEEEHEWSTSLTGARIHEAVQIIGTAVALAPGIDEPMASYKWLIDRVSASEGFLHQLVEEASMPNGMFTLVPALQDIMANYLESFELAHSRRWNDAIAKLKLAQAALQTAGFPVFACRLNINLGDNYLRVHQLQEVLDCIDRLDQLNSLTARPVSGSLKARAQQIYTAASERGSIAAVIEIDYVGVYGVGHEETELAIRFLKAQARSRLGDHAGALEALGETEWFDDVMAAMVGGVSFQALIAVALIVRDSGDPRRALTLLDKLEPFIQSPREAGTLHNAQGLLHEVLHDPDEARRYFVKARAAAALDTSTPTSVIDINLAQNELHRGRADEALALLDAIEVERQSRSESETQSYHLLRSIVLLSLNRLVEATTAINRAIEITETIRQRLRDFNSRISFLTKFLDVYRTAIRIALAAGDTASAFNLVEKSKARAFLDQLATGHLAVPEEGKPLVVLLDRLRLQTTLLSALREKCHDGQSVDLEVVSQLHALDSGLKLLEEDAPVPTLSATAIDKEQERKTRDLERVERQIEQLTLARANHRIGELVTVSEIQQMLAGE